MNGSQNKSTPTVRIAVLIILLIGLIPFAYPGLYPRLLKTAMKTVGLAKHRYPGDKSQLVREAGALLDGWHGDSARLKAAKDRLDQILVDDPRFSTAYVELARFQMASGYINFDNYEPEALAIAQGDLQIALLYDPNNAYAYLIYSHLHLLKGHTDLAQQALEKAEALGAEPHWTDLQRAKVLRAQQQDEEAEARFRKVANEGGGDIGLLLNAYEGLIDYAERRDDHAEANRLHRKLLELDPGNPWLWGNYAEFLLYKLEDTDGAIASARHALDIMDYGMGRHILARALYAKWGELLLTQHDSTEAKKIYDEAFRYQPDLDDVMAHSGWFVEPHVTAPALASIGVSINARDACGCTALQWAASNGRLEVVKQLVQLGADVNTTDDLGWTPLLRAARHGRNATVKLLLEQGANPRQVRDGKDVITIARDYDHLDTAELIRTMSQK